MEACDVVFVVLLYRNANDLARLAPTLARVPGRVRAVVVNSFYDESTRDAAQQICGAQGFDFLNVENRGYGAGNNAGIAYARAHYRFSFLVISNPDIEIEAMPALPPGETALYGPLVRTETGKRQNPYMPAFSTLRERLMRRFAKRPGNTLPFWAAVALNKAHRIWFNLLPARGRRRVYALHGSFLVFSAPALARLGAPFDERMFLFREEDHLARRAKALGIPLYYLPDMRVLHHEDGSVRFLTEGTRGCMVASLRAYFNL